MNAMPSSPKPAPTTWYGHLVTCETPGTIRPSPTETAIDVRPVRHQARYVRSFASRVRRVASVVSSKPTIREPRGHTTRMTVVRRLVFMACSAGALPAAGAGGAASDATAPLPAPTALVLAP